MKPTFYDFRSLMRIFMAQYDESLETKLTLPENVRVIVDDGNYQLLDVKRHKFLCEPMTKVEFFIFLKEKSYIKS